VVFYLSVSEHVGILGALDRIPWRVMIYEGHQSEDLTQVSSVLEGRFGSKVRMATLTRRADGDSRARPLAVFIRS
jgi:hypothetical protein